MKDAAHDAKVNITWIEASLVLISRFKNSTAIDPEKHALYPIPPIQIELSKVGSEDRLKQNPGW